MGYLATAPIDTVVGETAPSPPDIGSVADRLPRRLVDRTPAAPADAAPRRPTLRVAAAVLVVLATWAVGGFVGLYFQPPGLQLAMRTLGLAPGGGSRSPMRAVTEPDAADPRTALPAITGLGVLVPLGDVVSVARPYGAGDARVAERAVEEGQRVERGDVLAMLDNHPALDAARVAALAQLAARRASWHQVRASVAASRDESRAALSRAQAASANAGRELDRATALRARGIESQAVLDARHTAHDQAAEDVRRAQATLARYDADDLDRQPDVALARTAIDVAEAELARAAADLDRACVRAPRSGTVLRLYVRAGELPGPRGILSLADLDEMTAEVEVYQDATLHVAVGAPVVLAASALPTALHGTVSRVGLEVGRQTLTDASPAANTDARVVRVYVRLDAASQALARRFCHLQVTARIDAGAPR